ncbi:MAG: hypothetical protein IKK33_06655 [Lachnospiraceae bacterium]|nr:hypothetical protein [Lachnospiraceae bacterium]
MSMTTFMIWQMIGIFCAYFGVTLILPLIVFRHLLKGRTVINQILFSFLIGNSYIVTMVQILQLLKISNGVTLIVSTVVPAYVVWVKLNKVPVVKVAEEIGTNVKRITLKRLGTKTATYRLHNRFWKKSKIVVKNVGYIIMQNILEIILQIILLLVLIYVYGQGIISVYGYTASDIPVHNYWINALSDNNIYVAGVYPHGFHCVIYYLHKVFGFDTYILLSLFAFVQVVCINFALLYFLRLCCKQKYIAYAGIFFYAIGGMYTQGTYWRFSSSLPQEFGMIFILPAIYYGFEFFQERYNEVKQEKKKEKSLYSLYGFAMAFGLTLSAHFYNTIIAAFFCIAMALAYIFLLVRKQYFGNIVITCLISVLVAILPMGIAFATGTRLEGSLYWASNVIKGSISEEPSASTEAEGNIDSSVTEITSPNEFEISHNDSTIKQENIQENHVEREDLEQTQNQNIVQGKKKSFNELVGEISLKINTKLTVFIWNSNAVLLNRILWLSVIGLVGAGCVYYVLRKPCEGAMLFTISISTIILLIALTADTLGLPTLLDSSRCCIYVAYTIPVALTGALDAVITLCTGDGRWRLVGNVLSCLCIALVWIALISNDILRKPYTPNMFERNESITSLTNILRNNKDFTWTICSANDEFRMCEKRGYHYEIITLLKQLENMDEETIVTIPTEKVFFFIDKIPLDYASTYTIGEEKVSEEYANMNLSYAGGLAPYQSYARLTTMSRMYYWAQEFMRKYPNEMKVYLETDQFVCYVLEQNTYDLYNLAIDYGYNTRDK